MNATATVADAEPIVAGELTVIPRETALSVLTDQARFDDFYAKVKAEVEAFAPDLTTDKGRKAIAAMAFKVTKTKTAIDAAGKKLTEEWRTQTATVDAARKKIRDKLDLLRDEVRKPLTDWEAAEAERVEEVKRQMAALTAAAVVTIEDTAATVQTRLDEVRGRNLDPTLFGIEIDLAQERRDHAVQTLSAAHARLVKEEADRAELERLRKAEEGRLAAEAERVAQEAALRAAEEQRQREEQEARAAAERAEQERLAAEERAEAARLEAAAVAARAAEEAAARAARDAEERAAEERRQREAEHEAALAAERRRADEAERARQQEAAAAQREREEREAEEKAEADAKAKREADIAHRSGIMRAAKEAVMEHAALPEAKAKAVIQAIASKLIPAVTIQF